MTTVADVLAVAAAEIDQGVTPHGSNKTKYGAWFGQGSGRAGYLDGQAWCAMFVSWVLAKAGLPLTGAQVPDGFAWCPSGVAWFKRNSRWRSVNQLEPGDVVFFDFTGRGYAVHVGIVERVNSDGTVSTIEGNTSLANDTDGGRVMRRVRQRRHILGAGRPAYAPPAPVATIPPWPGPLHLVDGGGWMRGEAVVAWQRILGFRGQDLDGVFGPYTDRETRSLQRRLGLLADGVVGPITWARAHSQRRAA